MKAPYKIQEKAHELGIDHLRKQQVLAISALLSGKDVFLTAPTSFGKSAVAQVAGLVQNKLTLIVEPTLSLMLDQVQKLRALDIPAAYLSHSNHGEHDRILQEAKSDMLSFLYLTPEQLETKRETLCRLHPWLFVIDEAHCVLDWGCSFRPAYLKIDKFLSHCKQRPVVLAMTATAPPRYRRCIQHLLGMQHSIESIEYSLDKPRLSLIRCDIEDPGKDECRKQKILLKYLRKYGNTGSTVVYCSTQAKAAELYNYLDSKYPHQVAKCYSSMKQSRREKQESQFMCGEKSIMVATTAFGMGVSKQDLHLVLHYNLPLSVIDYYQQIGRAGRDGTKAHAVLLYDQNDIGLNHYLIDTIKDESVRKWRDGQLNQMISLLANRTDCMMQQVLCVLGERKEKRCKHCSNCQKRR
ncbi:RecQ family ATP-dependent DNA helicase [Oscillibacter ruminantium]